MTMNSMAQEAIQETQRKRKEEEREALQETKRKRREEKRQSFLEILKATPFWEHRDPKRIIQPKEGKTTEECIKRRIKLFDDSLYDTEHGFSNVLPDRDHDKFYMASDQILLQSKLMSLRLSYHLALEKMPTGATWKSVCTEATERHRYIDVAVDCC
jgi:hypothetical protein